jgi:site-specific recombinase XerD
LSTQRNDQGIRLVRSSPLSQDIAAFLIDRRARNLSPETIEFYRKKLKYLGEFLEQAGIQDTESITPHDLRRLLVGLGEQLTPGGVHCIFRAVRTFLFWYEGEYEPDEWIHPIRKVAAPKLSRKTLDPLSLNDLKAMLATCENRTFAGDRDRAVCLTLLDTGCRASEFLALDLCDVDLSTGAVTICHGKGSKRRVVFLGSKARHALMRYLRYRPEGDALWVTRRGKRLTYAGLRQIVRRLAKGADVPTPSLHSFRRAFALLSLRNGMDVYSLQKLMGHSDL